MSIISKPDMNMYIVYRIFTLAAAGDVIGPLLARIPTIFLYNWKDDNDLAIMLNVFREKKEKKALFIVHS